jgi:hypothetical protein
VDVPPKMKVKGYMYPQMKKPVGMLVFGLFRLNKQRFSSLGLYFKFGLYRIGVSIESFF